MMQTIGVTQISLLEKQFNVALYSADKLSEVVKNLTDLKAAIESIGAESESIPGFATGGYFSGGLRIVGESGPELEATGAAKIWSAQQLTDILTGNSSSTGAADEIHELRVEMRAQSAAMVRTQQKMTNIIERWNIAGMPEVRAA